MEIQKEDDDFNAWFNKQTINAVPDADLSLQRLWSSLAWQAQAAKAQVVPEWISVDDELPSEGDLLLGISTTKLAKFNVYQVVALDEFDDCEITHWMHLPQAPKAQEQSHE